MDNQTNKEVQLLEQLIFKELMSDGVATKLSVVTLVSLLFIYINSIMFYTIMCKPVFRELPRYILFAHMLCNDTVQMALTVLLFFMVLHLVQVTKAACALIIYASTVTYRNSALNIAVMSLERYVAFCFPLSHSAMATQNGTAVAIGVMWLLSSICPVIDIFYGMIMDPMFYSGQMFCYREMFVRNKWQIEMFQAANGVSFAGVTLIIVFTYINVIVAARTMSGDKDSAQKALKTVLLHLIQLIFCLLSLMYGTINTLLTRLSNSTLIHDVRFINFLLILMVPRCLSPLIYGLRDDAIRPLFLYYVRGGFQKVKPSVTAH
ncbi:odorant receptor 131-2-like [Alosa pseudoharengus]|uniref:odorant receptor 131-2-like n=1 Tax=Alosa pseudoharengus TaxID=34774 RepID=UPI003F8933AF